MSLLLNLSRAGILGLDGVKHLTPLLLRLLFFRGLRTPWWMKSLLVSWVINRESLAVKKEIYIERSKVKDTGYPFGVDDFAGCFPRMGSLGSAKLPRPHLTPQCLSSQIGSLARY